MSDDGRVDVDAIRAMLDAITQGDWRACKDGECVCGLVFAEGNDILVHTPGNQDDHDRIADDDHIKSNAAFIAAAPALVRSMVDEIVELRERVAEQSAIIAGLGDVIAGRVKPISQLWDEIEADDAQP